MGDRLRSILATPAGAADDRPDPGSDSVGVTADPPRVRQATGRHREPGRRWSGLFGRGYGESGGGPGRERPGLRWVPDRSAGRALIGLSVMTALLAAALMWWQRPQPAMSEELPTLTTPLADTSTASAGQASGAGASADGSEASATEETLVVAVIGQVARPGLVTVVDGARVADAITAAGGALPGADLGTVNLARRVVDGEQIAIGVPGAASPGDSGSSSPDGLLDLNTATLAELEELTGIGPVLAQRIIDFREDTGGFTQVEQLREVSGIGPSVYDDIADLVTV